MCVCVWHGDLLWVNSSRPPRQVLVHQVQLAFLRKVAHEPAEGRHDYRLDLHCGLAQGRLNDEGQGHVHHAIVIAREELANSEGCNADKLAVGQCHVLVLVLVSPSADFFGRFVGGGFWQDNPPVPMARSGGQGLLHDFRRRQIAR